MIRRLLSWLLLVFFTCSCSIKENRNDCPCWLNIFFSSSDENSGDLIVAAWNENQIFSERIKPSRYGNFYERKIGRGVINLSAFHAGLKYDEERSQILIPYGQQSDSIYAYSSKLLCFCEFVRDTIFLHKQFATVYLKLINMDSPVEYGLAVRGLVNGLSFPDLQPVRGDFCYDSETCGENEFKLRIPRQLGDSLIVRLVDKECGRILDSLNLAPRILSSGYDWNSVDLKDLLIKLDFSNYDISVNVHTWEDGREYEEII